MNRNMRQCNWPREELWSQRVSPCCCRNSRWYSGTLRWKWWCSGKSSENGDKSQDSISTPEAHTGKQDIPLLSFAFLHLQKWWKSKTVFKSVPRDKMWQNCVHWALVTQSWKQAVHTLTLTPINLQDLASCWWQWRTENYDILAMFEEQISFTNNGNLKAVLILGRWSCLSKLNWQSVFHLKYSPFHS